MSTSPPAATKAASDGHLNERQVTDPVTHLPVTVWDLTSIDLERIPPTLFSDHDDSESRSISELAEESNKQHANTAKLVHNDISRGFWPNTPAEENRARLGKAMVAGSAAALGSVMSRFVSRFTHNSMVAGLLNTGILSISTFVFFIFFEPLWFKPFRPRPEEAPKPKPRASSKFGENEEAETVVWLNSLLKGVWPIIDPGLFTSIGDLLEDSLTATLPKGINAVRVADIGQGSEPIRFLGIRWLKAGQANKETDGMVGEEGDFANFEAALAFRSDRTTEHGLKSRQRNPHLLIQLFTIGGARIPIWVEISALLATVRVRLQLTPNPPFLSLATVTFLGQPKITMSCIPLASHFLNVMDVPGLSQFIQKAIDGVIQAYVAPRSIALDLRAMLMGRGKLDTDALGVFVITVKSAKDFKDGDEAKFWQSDSAKHGDCYVTVGWAKWSKVLWTSRIISHHPEPKWEETMAILIKPTEVNAKENLCLQLWDSDRTSADDLLGTVQVPLSALLEDSSIHNTSVTRTDKFTSPDDKNVSGTLTWSIAYYRKTTFEQHVEHKENMDADLIKKSILENAQKKLREALPTGLASHAEELKQQKEQDLKEKTDEVIADTPPTPEWPSGILSVTIESISGLEIHKLHKTGQGDHVEFEEDESDDLPSPYCTVIINHQVLYRTRTKLKTTKPFFNACTERFIRNWQNTTIMIAAKDSRLHEGDAILGVVHLSLGEIFAKSSMVTDLYPIAGGIASGRIKLAFTFRSIQASLPKELVGWDVGTLDIEPTVTASSTNQNSSLGVDFSECQLVFRTLYDKGKMYPDEKNGGWAQKRGKPIRLAVKERYSSCLYIQFRKKRHIGKHSVEGFSTLWLKDIVDMESLDLALPIHRNADDVVESALVNATDEYGEKVGTLHLRLKYWSGLSGYHQAAASSDAKMKSVMQALDCAQHEHTPSTPDEGLDLKIGGEGDSSSDESDDEVDVSSENGGADGGERKSNGAFAQIKSFKDRKDDLHRQHRGLMQWKPARNLAWITNGIEEQARDFKNTVEGLKRHSRPDVGIDREV
ncbi:hypothetical protein DL96DRAFT_1729312 [Flagelloscypha sp. PMI_526]|nr:hypothetical protein DL96DRAFT_1729312 [Flagelloscypha sp. PMI_526]